VDLSSHQGGAQRNNGLRRFALGGTTCRPECLDPLVFGMITENGRNYVKSAAIAQPSIDECGVSP